MCETATKLTLNDLITEQHGRVKFPTLASCVCGGINRCSNPNENYSTDPTGEKHWVNDRDLAYQVAVLQHGYYLAKWEGQNVANKEYFPKACTCTCDHEIENSTPRAYFHVATCTKCGMSSGGDSSD